MFKPSRLIALLLLLIPSLVQVWLQRDMPRFGDFHDDSVYYVTAKSLADGGGYRIESLPGEPAQTKYPPLYPLLLSLAWRLDPQFPHNLRFASWISWLAFPAVLFQLPLLFRRLGFSSGRTWLLLVLFAVNPYVALFSTQILSEMLFLALLLASLLLTDRSLDAGTPPGLSAFFAVAAGAAGGLAYLTRTAGMVLLAAALIYLWTRKRRLAVFFAAGMVPFMAAWALWVKIHEFPTTDLSLLYYTDYFRFQIYSFRLSESYLYLWRYVDAILWGLGALILPKVTGSWLMKVLAQVIAVAMIAGIVRMARRGEGRLYAWYAALGAALLAISTFPGNERLTLPMFPLALAGLLVEMERFFGMSRAGLRHKDLSQRVAAGGIMAVAAFLFAGALALQIYVGQVFMPQDAQQHRVWAAGRSAPYEWAQSHLPAGASVLATQDVLFYLHTGHHAMRATLPPLLWYREDHDAIVNWFTDLKPFARDRGLSYFEFSGADTTQGVDDEGAATIEARIRKHPDLSPLYESPGATMYAFR